MRYSVLLGSGIVIFWIEQTLNLIVCTSLIALVIGLLWFSLFVAFSTSFLWLPLCLICLPLLVAVAILLRYTRLRGSISDLLTKLGTEPLKSKLWAQGMLPLAQK